MIYVFVCLDLDVRRFHYWVLDLRNGLFISHPLEMLHIEYILWQAKVPI